MRQTRSLAEKRQQFLAILIPILTTQLALFSMTFFDTIMSGKAGANDLAGVAIGSSLWLPISTGFTGILLAVTPLVAQYTGAGQRQKVPFTVIQGIYLAIALCVVVILGGAAVLKPVLHTMQLDAPVRDIAYRYLIGLSFGIPAMFVYMVLRCFIEALGYTRVTMIITLLSLPINVTLNYILIFGKLGFPRLGGVGAGYATGITYWCIFLIALYTVHKIEPFAKFGIFKKRPPVSLAEWKRQLKLGIPIGLTVFFETAVFACVTLLMSQFDTITIAAHQAAMNFSSLLYMIPLSISMALTITVGFELGAKRYRDAKIYSFMGIAVALGLALCCGVLLALFNKQIAWLYTNDVEVFTLTRQFLIFALFFLLSDAIATPAHGILRGYQDVNVAFFIALASFWIIGLPVGHLLASFTHWGAFGYWIGLIVGLAIGAVCLLARMVSLQRKTSKQT